MIMVIVMIRFTDTDWIFVYFATFLLSTFEAYHFGDIILFERVWAGSTSDMIGIFDWVSNMVALLVVGSASRIRMFSSVSSFIYYNTCLCQNIRNYSNQNINMGSGANSF